MIGQRLAGKRFDRVHRERRRRRRGSGAGAPRDVLDASRVGRSSRLTTRQASRATVGGDGEATRIAIFRPRRGRTAIGAHARGAMAIGALAVGAAAVGGFAIGRLSVGRLAVGRAAVGKLKVEELEIGRLRVRDAAADAPRR